jgi:hypothetical protein
VAASSVTSGAGIRGGGQPTWGGDDRRPSAPLCGERGQREQGGAWDRTTVPGGQNGNEPPTGGPGPAKYIFKFSNSTQTCKYKKEAFPYSKNIHSLHAAIFEYLEQLSQLGQLQILNRTHVINSGTQFNLKIP